MFGFGIGELIVILIVVLVLFGPGRLPELGGALGASIKNFKKGYRDAKAIDVTPAQAPLNVSPKNEHFVQPGGEQNASGGITSGTSTGPVAARKDNE